MLIDKLTKEFDTIPTQMSDDASQESEVFALAMAKSHTRQYSVDDGVNARGNCLRASTLGKPAVLQLLQFEHIQDELLEMGIELPDDDPTERRSLMFHLGDWFEAWFEQYLIRNGVQVLPPPDGQAQWEFTFHNALGHADIIGYYPPDDTFYVFECKSMASYLVKSFMREPLKYRPEYITQAAIYAHGLEQYLTYNVPLDHAEGGSAKVVPVIAALSLDERSIYYLPVKDYAHDALRRASKLCEVLPNITSLSQVPGVVKPPPGEPVLYRGKVASDYLVVPQSMKYLPMDILQLFYQVEEISCKVGRYVKTLKVVGEIIKGREVTDYVTR